eukprot:1694288-Amphidinium_carterae.1
MSRIIAAGTAQALRYLCVPVWGLTSGPTVPGRAGEVDMRASRPAILAPGGCEVGDFADTVARAIIKLFGLELSSSLKVALNAHSAEETPGIARAYVGPSLMHDATVQRAVQPVHPLEVPQALQRAMAEPGWIRTL